MDIIKKAREFETRKQSFNNTSERILASREAKDIILNLNEVYKLAHDPYIMDLMKVITEIKKHIEKRLKGRPLTSI